MTVISTAAAAAAAGTKMSLICHERMEVEDDFSKIQCPARIQISGPTLVGKSEFIAKLVQWRDHVFSVPFQRILYFLPEDGVHARTEYLLRLRNYFPPLDIREGLPELKKLPFLHDRQPSLVILEDLADEMLNSADMLGLFFKESHHLNITVLYRYFYGIMHCSTLLATHY